MSRRSHARWIALVGAAQLVGLVSIPVLTQERAQYEIVIKNGMILDGTGNPFFVGDVAIANEKIAEIGVIDAARGRRVIDATGFYVTPGFFDMHSHSAGGDGSIADPVGRKGYNSVSQGIATETTNPPWPLSAQLEKYRTNKHALNEIVSVNFANVRNSVMGYENRPPTPAELEKMREMIREGFRQGARYLFVNLENGMPDRFASTEELIELAKVVKENRGYYDTHQRSEGISPIWYNASGHDYNPASHSPVVDGVQAVQETVRIAEESGAKVVGHHVKVKGKNFWGASKSYIELMDRARSRGVQVYFSIYGYTSYGNWPNVTVIPIWARTDPGVDSRMLRNVKDPYKNAKANFERVLADPKAKADLVKDIQYQFTKAGGPEHLLLVEYSDKQYAGKTLQDIADMRNTNAVDMLIWLQQNGDPLMPGGGGWRALDTDDQDVENFIKTNYTAYVTDGGNILPNVGFPHPRYYGIYPRFIRRYVLDKNVVTLPHMIRGMTSLAAQITGVTDRGLLKPGYWADVNVFDPVSIRDNATYMNPHQYATGFRWVLINGVPVVDDGKFTDALPGKELVGAMTVNKAGSQ